jgi:hypothetical protein
VFSPFNCSLRKEQIDFMNALAGRSRRSGIVLTLGPGVIEDSIAAKAVAALGIRLKTRTLARSPLRELIAVDRLSVPLTIAIRRGRIIGMLAGESAERLDSWITWLEGDRDA